MGYETELVFVTGNNKTKAGRICGYQSVEATLEMGKCADNFFGALIDRCREEVKAVHDELSNEADRVEEMQKELFTHEGDFTPELEAIKSEAGRTKRCAPYYKAKKALEARIPFFFKDGNTELYTDAYGDLLLVASLKDVREAIIKDNAREICEGNYEFGYRRFNMALKFIEGMELMGEEVHVILYGH